MLQNAVAGVPELKSVKTANDRDIANGQPPLTYEKYKHLLMSTASIFDEHCSPTRPRHSCGIHQTETFPMTFEDPSSELCVNSHALHPSDDDGDIFYDIDTDHTQVQVNMSDRSHPKSSPSKFGLSMGRDKWYSLSPSEQTV